jgi:hypothetical protein
MPCRPSGHHQQKPTIALKASNGAGCKVTAGRRRAQRRIISAAKSMDGRQKPRIGGGLRMSNGRG